MHCDNLMGVCSVELILWHITTNVQGFRNRGSCPVRYLGRQSFRLDWSVVGSPGARMSYVETHYNLPV